jgi:hypothetical protein
MSHQNHSQEGVKLKIDEELKFIKKWLKPLLRFFANHKSELEYEKGIFHLKIIIKNEDGPDDIEILASGKTAAAVLTSLNRQVNKHIQAILKGA